MRSATTLALFGTLAFLASILCTSLPKPQEVTYYVPPNIYVNVTVSIKNTYNVTRFYTYREISAHGNIIDVFRQENYQPRTGRFIDVVGCRLLKLLPKKTH